MPVFDYACTSCAWSDERLTRFNDNPTCPDCGQPTERIWIQGHMPAVIADDIPGGLVVRNLGHEPVKVYSHSERRRIAKERGLVERIDHAPIPGTDKSPFTTRWATPPAVLSEADEAERIRQWHAHETRLQAELAEKS